MSGIFGVFDTTGTPVDPIILKAMSTALAHRGPDGDALWIKRNVGFGHRMFKTTPEAEYETLPFCDPISGLAITCDARLDNRDELIGRIGKDNFASKEITDSTIVLWAYRKWDADCVNYLLGDFSFGIWDSRKQILFCARDHIGVKPFNYRFEQGQFFFSSESQTIAYHCGQQVTINEPRLADSLTPHLEGYDKTSTLYNSIFRLPAGHYLIVKNGYLSTSSYWSLQPHQADTKHSDQHYLEEMTELLTSAVTARCRGVNNPGLLLSGGVDSCSIMGILQHMDLDYPEKTFHTFSGISDDINSCLESRMITTMVDPSLQSTHLYSISDFREHLDDTFKLVTNLQEPFDMVMGLIFFLYQRASKHGCRVVLDGADGDAVASLPLTYPSRLFFKEPIGRVFHEVNALCNDTFQGVISTHNLFLRYLISACIPEYFRKLVRFYRRHKNTRYHLQHSFATSSFLERTHLKKRLLQFEKLHTISQGSFPHGLHAKKVHHPFLSVGLERYDRVAALCNIEPRHPLLDKRILEFCNGLPWDQLVRNGHTKYLLRCVAQQYIPSQVCWRFGKEHVGYLFNKEIITRKKTEIKLYKTTINSIFDTIIKLEPSLQSLGKYCTLSITDKEIEKTNLVGLILWLNNSLELQGSGEKNDFKQR